MKVWSLYFLVSETLAWSGSAHIDVTWLAWNLLGRKGKRYLRQHLGDDPREIYRASTWADSDAAITLYPESDRLHYSNTPFQNCQPFVLKRDCGSGDSRKCVVTGFADFAIIASDPTQPVNVRAEAIRFLLHLLADMHQPLHTGFREDFGGNTIRLSQPELSLHEVWDYGLFDSTIQEGSISPLANTIKVPSDISSYKQLLQFAIDIVSETSTKYTCFFAYTDTDGKYIQNHKVLSPEYMVTRKAIAMDRLRIAGIRLAEFISALAENYFSRISSPKRASPPISDSIALSNQFAVLEDLLGDIDDSDESVSAPISVQESTQMISVVVKIPKHQLDDGTFEIDQVFERPQSVANVSLSDIVFLRIGTMVILSSRSVLRNPFRMKYPAVVSDQVFSIKYTMRGRHRHGHNLDLAVDRDCAFSDRLTVDDVQLILKNHYGERFRYEMAIVEIPFEDPTHYPVLSNEIRARITQHVSLRRHRLWRVGGFPQHQEVDTLRQMDARYYAHVDILRSQAREARQNNMTMQEYWERSLITKFQSASAVQFENTLVFFHRDTFTTNLCSTRSFMLFTTVANLNSPFFLIDTNLFDGDITPRIVYTLMRIQALKLERNPMSVGTLVQEMFHFINIYSDTGMDRLRNSPFQEMASYPSPLSDTIAYFQWNLTSEFTERMAC